MIDSIEMVNWRAYDHQKFDFEPGITFLMGLNGRGKTSILEAIGYAFTGEPTTVDNRAKLLRDPAQLATVRAVFSLGDQSYLIERKQSSRRAEEASLSLLQSGRIARTLARSNNGVNHHLEDLLGTSTDFLTRIIYMSEGDVFRFVNKPPGEALDSQIRQVLGLTQLDEYLSALKQANRKIQKRMDSLKVPLNEFTKLEASKGVSPGEWQKKVEAGRQERLADLRYLEEKSGILRQENRDLLQIRPLLDNALTAVMDDQESSVQAAHASLIEMNQRLADQAELLQQTIRDLEIESAQLQGENSTHAQTLQILSPYHEHNSTLPCPVCSKPMSADELIQIIAVTQNKRKQIKQRRGSLTREIAEQKQILARTKLILKSLRELRSVLAHTQLEGISPEYTVLELDQIVSEQLSQYEMRSAQLKQQSRLVEEEIARLDRENAEYVGIKGRFSGMGFDSPETAKKGMVELEIRLLSLQAARTAAQEVLTDRRNIDMDRIYDQIAQVWGAFTGRSDWKIHLNQKGIPIFVDEKGREFDFSQFSGGEKTALLVVLHTIIAQHFSDTDFLLIDEPLEHLDAVNRRSLIRFLIQAYRGARFQQAIVATFEESLIRKYMSDEDVHVIHLP